MSNPYGLTELNHFGQMQRVGGKAAGFINKKFFHPSSMRNQEKLWKAHTAAAVEQRRQSEMEKRREEERQVEELRKQMYLAGQGNSSASFVAAGSSDSKSERLTSDQAKALEEQKRRRAQLKQERAAKEQDAGEDDEVEALGDAEAVKKEEVDEGAKAVAAPERPLTKSSYAEDRHVRGHVTVWGSWYTMEEKLWGFACCKGTDFKARCPLAPEEEEPEKAKRGERGGKRRRKGAADGETPQSGDKPNASAEGTAVGSAG
eukprot:TRINITY_DN338_c0_g1_i1.p1 TRINITY_DN338_c0_g1~~TRINITY_DN338_c0_g1_i1.p1  ORF type:complete len:299 (-),score=87.92 TRINITY_DN338_c0_g1_i1:45-824(-)